MLTNNSNTNSNITDISHNVIVNNIQSTHITKINHNMSGQYIDTRINNPIQSQKFIFKMLNRNLINELFNRSPKILKNHINNRLINQKISNIEININSERTYKTTSSIYINIYDSTINKTQIGHITLHLEKPNFKDSNGPLHVVDDINNITVPINVTPYDTNKKLSIDETKIINKKIVNVFNIILEILELYIFELPDGSEHKYHLSNKISKKNKNNTTRRNPYNKHFEYLKKIK